MNNEHIRCGMDTTFRLTAEEEYEMTRKEMAMQIRML